MRTPPRRAAILLGVLLLGTPLRVHAQDPTPPSPALIRAHDRLLASPPVRLTFTGDINLGTTFLPGGVPADSAPSAFAAVDSLLVGDLVIGNYEGAFSDTLPAGKCGGARNCYEFRTPRWLVTRLLDAGFTHLNQANNHASDLGVAGREETRALFDQVGLKHYGMLGDIAVDTVVTAGCGLLAEPCGRTVVAVVGFTTYPFAYDLLDIARARVVVDSMARLADVVVVTFHGGTEGHLATRLGRGMEHMKGEPRGDLRRFTHAVIDAGADVVVGHGPHVLRGIEFYRGRPIAYSMGNFLTWHGFNIVGVNGLTGVLQLEVNADGSFARGRFVPLRQVKWVGVRPDPRRAALALVRRVTRLDFPRTGAVLAADGSITEPRPVPPRRGRGRSAP